ncbi:NADPH-dependent FMN reductase [Cohnella nanjingensis]|uniref:NAD(P)H-dependent oxidoreductase n=1 Tax=Cohnella nanjingensis TaxID=1387779 RepID=A0A7X0VE89_9BACL|nr:NAD(P)H-dependent oxidoreductase [Cohnella nanjingensis]MBB6670481.1 NAD(P)H-dependent oxidoreductase [Cohnella nanjingensis]
MSSEQQSITIVGLCGSTRKASYNRVLLRAAAAYLPSEATYLEAEIGELPFFNQDLESALPEQVASFVDMIRSADGLMISTPEYNYSVPGVLKNALEWGSRPSFGFPLNEKPVAIIGASRGIFGPVRGHRHLRDILFGCNAAPLSRPEVYVNHATAKINDEGTLVDEAAHDLLRAAAEALILAARMRT